MTFTELEGMILLEPAEAAAEALQRLREQGQPLCRWRYERGANHVHADMSAGDRKRVREELAFAAELEAALRAAYPDRDFVISHLPGYAVSFYQWAEEADAEDEKSEDARDTAWCQHCQRYRPFHPRPERDPELPGFRWGACVNCNRDLLLDRRERRKRVRRSRG